jgi:hypothetical protein
MQTWSFDHQTYHETLDTLRRIATHVAARAQHAHTGRIGLRPSPGGFATTEHGPDSARLRVSDGLLVSEARTPTGTQSRVVAIDGRSLAQLAEFAGVDLMTELSVGHDTPVLGDVDAPLSVDPGAARVIAEWLGLAAQTLDHVVAQAPGASPTLAQLWPEHFDVALDLAFDASSPGERRVNLGGSPGDEFHASPYLYVGPWTPDRPGHPAYWNAPFGAVLGLDHVRSAADPVATAVGFFRTGLGLLAG